MDIWHARLRHIRKEALEKALHVVDGVALGTREYERTSELCPECYDIFLVLVESNARTVYWCTAEALSLMRC